MEAKAKPQVIANLCKVFGDENAWKEAPPLPAPEPAMTKPAPAKKRKGRGNETANDSTPSDSNEAVMNVSNVAESFRRHNRRRRGGRKAKSSEPAAAAQHPEDQGPTEFSDLGLKQGEMAPQREAFLPWKFLVRYAEMYVGKANTPLVEPFFEPDELFFRQSWDFFYVYHPNEPEGEPRLLVPSFQLADYLRTVNDSLGINLSIPGGTTSAQFYMRFGGLGGPRPRYLGRTTRGDATSYQVLVDAVPLPEPEDDMKNLRLPAKEEFLELLQQIDSSCKSSGKKKKSDKAAQKRYANRKRWGKSLKRVQRYLGLREKTPTFQNYREVVELEESSAGLLDLDVNAPAPFEPEGSVVFICFDIETYEKSKGTVTEIGFAVLDTEDTRGVAPGEGGENWFGLIKARHLRIKEYSYMVNREFVQGCPNDFNFGESEMVPLDEILAVVEGIMVPPASSSSSPPPGDAAAQYNGGACRQRPVVVVGHDVKQDIELLGTLDFDVNAMPNLVEVVDNQKTCQHRSRFYNGQSLGAVLSGLAIPHSYLHNGGNDAVYTLQCLVRCAVLARRESLVRARAKKGRSAGAAGAGPAQRADFLTNEGWSSGGEDTDGGYPGQSIAPKPLLRYEAPEFPVRPHREDTAEDVAEDMAEVQLEDNNDRPHILGGW